MTTGIEDIDTEEEVPVTRLPPYVLLRKSIAKVMKDPYSVKYKDFTPFLPEDVPVKGDQVPILKMEDWDLGDHIKFLQLEPNKYLKSVYYEESSVRRLEPMKWVTIIEHVGFLNMLWVPHFSHKLINTI